MGEKTCFLSPKDFISNVEWAIINAMVIVNDSIKLLKLPYVELKPVAEKVASKSFFRNEKKIKCGRKIPIDPK